MQARWHEAATPLCCLCTAPILPDPHMYCLYRTYCPTEYVLDALADAQDFLAVAKSGDALSGPHLPAEPLYEGGHTLDSFKWVGRVEQLGLHIKILDGCVCDGMGD